MDQPTLAFNLSIEQTNVILKALTELPFKESADVIVALRTQAAPQVQAAPAPTTED